MLNPLYLSVKRKLQTSVSAIKDIQLYNKQYDGIIHIEPISFIEFPDEIDLGQISKTSARTNCPVRVHILTRILTDTDNTVPDLQVAAHETLVTSVITALNHYTPITEASVKIGSPLIHTGYRSVPDYKGWLVTHLTFVTKLLV